MNIYITALVSILITALFASQVAGRLDKLHRRVSSAKTMLWRRCNERYVEVSKLADPDLMQVINQAKSESMQGLFAANQSFLESEITRKLQQANQPVSIQSAQIRLQDARRMHNEAVRATLYLRSWRISRWLRLAGRAHAPKYIDFDDSLLNLN